MKARTLLTILLLVMLPLAGCIKKEQEEDTDIEQAKADAILGETGRERIVDAAAVVPRNYSFPGQAILPQVTTSFTGHVEPAATLSYEGERDQSGTEYNTIVQMQDISSLVPPGQPVELVLRLIWDGAEANSADLDIAVNVPGVSTTHSPVSETYNWNIATKQMVVNTVGVAGMPAEVGVQIASGVVSQGFDYTLEVHATYVKDVLTPHHPWAFDVPEGASGIILESEAAGGEEHVTSQFVVIGPNDELVQFVDFNDIDIPTQSIFIPTSTPGTYVFYAYFMHGGFLRAEADVPLEVHAVSTLKLKETEVIDMDAPAPGVAGKDAFNGSAAEGTLPSDDVNAVTVDFTPEGAFPLRVEGFIRGQATSMAKITLTSPKGEVHQRTVIAHYEDERGSIGYTSDHEDSQNNRFTWANIAKGTWSAQIVNDSPGVQIGHTVLTYTR